MIVDSLCIFNCNLTVLSHFSVEKIRARDHRGAFIEPNISLYEKAEKITYAHTTAYFECFLLQLHHL